MPSNSFTARIFFHGTIACVPDGDRVRMLLCQFDPSILPRPITCYVRFAEANYSIVNQRRIDNGGPNGNASPAVQGLRKITLDREYIAIDAPGLVESDQKLHVNAVNDPSSGTPVTGFDDRSMYWLPSVTRLHPDRPTVKSALLANDLANATPTVVASVDITQGRFRTNGVQKVQVPFRTETGIGGLQAVAREAVLELKIAGDHFTLRSKPIDGGPSLGDMRFDANGADVVNIVIGNEPPEDIFQETPRIEPVDILVEEAASEFGLYYQMCEKGPANPKLPFVAARPGLHQFCLVAVVNTHG